jgi:EmrB/QacA subfamily drug resistance transporter
MAIQRSSVAVTTDRDVPGSGRRLGLALAVIATAQLMVYLDTTIVNVALPHIQGALGFSGSGLEWVVNAYAVTFGGLLLLGGRAGDRLGRRRVLTAGLLLFAAASLAGGLATDQAWLLAARAVQGSAAAVIAPANLALVTTTFPAGRPRTRAMAVYAGATAVGGAVGLIAGGLLATDLSWRWVLFVNVPIGCACALAGPRVLARAPRQRGRFDIPGAITGSAGLTLLVYGLSSAASGQPGGSHWAEPRVAGSLAAAAVLLAAFIVIELRSRDPLLPLRLLRTRDRSGAYLIMLCNGTAMYGIFFFLTLFMQETWGYSPLRTGVAYLPMIGVILVLAGACTPLIGRIGARPLLVTGSAITAAGMWWLSRISEHATYTHGLLGPMVVSATGMGLVFVPMNLVAMARVPADDTGVASSVLNSCEQIGGSIGLASLGTITWSAVAGSIRAQTAAAAAAARAGGGNAGHAGREMPAAIFRHALTTGISAGFEAAAGVALFAIVIAVAFIRISRHALSAGGSND